MADPQDRQSASVQARRERGRQLREQHARRKRMRQIAVGAIGGTLVVLVVGFLLFTFLDNRRQAANDEETLSDRVAEFPATRNHVQGDVVYPQTPPVGGDHDAAWQNCGFYDQPVRNEHAVHSLEHGAVWITYSPDLDAEQVQTLRDKADQGYVLVSPFPGLPAPVVASAWGLQIQLDSADDDGLDAFIREYRQGDQTPEPGAACTRGIGQPL